MFIIKDLEVATSEFFSEYCRKEKFGEFPEWSNKWTFKGTLPYNNEKGCYAHLNKKDEVIYVGLGISNSNQGSGIGSRVSKYWTSTNEYVDSEKLYKSADDNVTSIVTIPFKDDTFYLAPALETYLIQKLTPTKNRIHSSGN
ncbi:MAG: hypothetical protein JJE55_02750 [Flavobacteriaceae bacterium]|nr:hypothetical protein [Flavobacteriaceae bacterium]